MRSGCNVTDISDLYTKKYNTCGFNHLRQGKMIEENSFLYIEMIHVVFQKLLFILFFCRCKDYFKYLFSFGFFSIYFNYCYNVCRLFYKSNVALMCFFLILLSLFVFEIKQELNDFVS